MTEISTIKLLLILRANFLCIKLHKIYLTTVKSDLESIST